MTPPKPHSALHGHLTGIYYLLFALTIGLGIGNIVYLSFLPETTMHALFFCGLQYMVILLILTFPIVLRKQFMIQIPLIITVLCAAFGFVAMVMGDGLNFYGKYRWWDSALHLFSGCVLAFVGLWIISIIFEDNHNAVLGSRIFLAFYVLLFGVTCGVVWEICEYAYDAFFGTNTQQFMASTTSSLPLPEDTPLSGHAALRDTMTDLILDLVGSLLVAVYVFFRYDKLMPMHHLSSQGIVPTVAKD
jgi:hypothetical protein